MAFEAFLSESRPRSRGRRDLALLISLAAHAAAALLVGAVHVGRTRSAHPRPPTQLAAEGPRVPVRIWNAAFFAHARQSAPTVEAKEPAPRPLHAGHRPRPRRPRAEAPVLPSIAHAEADRGAVELPPAPVVPPPLPEPERDLAREADLLREAALPAPAEAAMPSPIADTAAAAFPAPTPAAHAPALDAPFVPTSFAQGLRVYEYFPRLPLDLSGKGASYVVQVDVCVSSQGRVDDVILKQSAAPELDALLLAAIRTWRYRPWRWGDQPMPFCHGLRVVYRVE